MSDFRRQGAALIAGFLLMGLVSPAIAAGKSHKPRKPPRSMQPHAHATGGEIAELTSTQGSGLKGAASFYGGSFSGRKTSSGDRFDPRLFTGASNHFSLGTFVSVQRLDNAQCAIVKINDRMAAHGRRIIDVSRGVAEYLGMVREGVVLVRVAPLKAGSRTPAGCQAAFEPDEDCPACSGTRAATGLPTPSLNQSEQPKP